MNSSVQLQESRQSTTVPENDGHGNGETLQEQVQDEENNVHMSSAEQSDIILMTTNLWDKGGSGRYSQRILEENIRPLDSLQHQFTYFVQVMKERSEVFAVISKWTEQVYIALDAVKSEDMDLPDGLMKNLQKLLEKEAKTWDLLMRLYFYRLDDRDEEMREDMESQLKVERINEQPVVDFILGTNQELGEVNIVLNWLEASFGEKTGPDLTSRFVSWEQTLETLKRDELLGKRTNENMVLHMDPDACLREKKELHILDMEEESKVQKGVYYYIRSGQFGRAIAFLNESAHITKAAALNGMQFTVKIPCNTEKSVEATKETGYTEDVNPSKSGITDENNSTVKYRISGNLQRDLWKKIAFKICETKKQTKYERATLGALCGHRQSMLEVASTWEDRLWAYLKCLNDVRVEEELRKRSNANYLSMPDEYWSQTMSVAECLRRIDTEGDSIGPGQNFSHIFHVVQNKLMLDHVASMMEVFRDYIPHFFNEGLDHQVIVGQVSRFLTHMILVLSIIGIPYDEELMDICCERYIKVLVASKQLVYIPFYVNCMSEFRQIPVILDQVDPNTTYSEEDILTFIRTAAANNMNALSIGIAIVEKLFSEQDDFNEGGLLWISATYPYVEDNSQVMLALLRHTLIISRKYLVLGKTSKVKELLNLIKPECLSHVIRISDKYQDTLIREYICYNVYMEGEDYLQMWNRAIAQRPISDDTWLSNRGTLADRVLTEKKTRDFENLEGKWKKAVNHYLKQTIDTFMKLLKFPNGWLLDCVDLESEEEEDLAHINGVRRIILPKVVFVLIKLIQESKSQRQMRELLYVICEEHRQILKELRQSGISAIFKAIEESTRVVSANTE